MMLKIKKSKVKLGGAVFLALLFCISYVSISFYSVPEKASAVTWFPQEETRTLADIEYMQEMNKSVCDKSEVGDTNDRVIDTRDGSVYSIAKLADGNCWMTRNLTLDLTKAGIATAAESDNLSADYPATALLNRFDTASTNAWKNINALDEFSKAPAKVYRGGSYQPNYGYYYSWCAATGKTCSEVAMDGDEASGSICPKGWTLPTTAQYSAIKDVHNGHGFNVLAGITYSNGLEAAGSQAYYWSRTTANNNRAYYFLVFKDSGGSIGNNEYYTGFSVRCINNERILESGSSTDSTSGSIAVKVANTLSIDAVSGMEEEVDSTSVANGAITATIAANTNYKVLLSAEKTSLTSTSSTNTAEIPALSTVQAGTNAWGIRNSDNSTYSAITNQEKEYHNTTALSTNPNIPGTVHTFNIGISVSPSLPADTYSTEVTITAAAA